MELDDLPSTLLPYSDEPTKAESLVVGLPMRYIGRVSCGHSVTGAQSTVQSHFVPRMQQAQALRCEMKVSPTSSLNALLGLACVRSPQDNGT